MYHHQLNIPIFLKISNTEKKETFGANWHKQFWTNWYVPQFEMKFIRSPFNNDIIFPIYLVMVRNYKRTLNKAKILLDIPNRNCCKTSFSWKNISCRSVAQNYNVPFKKLSLYCIKNEHTGHEGPNQVSGIGYSKHKQIFSLLEE